MMAETTILVIEDDAAIRRGILDALRFHSYQVLEAANGEEGLELAVGSDCQLVLLDVVLPGQDGFSVLHSLSQERPGLPVILLTARGAEEDRVRGLRLGADDYVVKPFSVRELMARVEAVLRRGPLRSDASIAVVPIPGGAIDFSSAELRFDDGKRVSLSDRELRVIRYLSCHRGRIVSREELLQRVWMIDPKGIETRSVDMQIARLREKLGHAAILATIRGKGYLWAGEEPAS
jgi:DNA-binding response OmpR family regulator